MKKKAVTVYLKDDINRALEAVKDDRDYTSKMTIVHDLFSSDPLIRKGIFAYLDVYLTKYYRVLKINENRTAADEAKEKETLAYNARVEALAKERE